jgi:hypothetical protein
VSARRLAVPVAFLGLAAAAGLLVAMAPARAGWVVPLLALAAVGWALRPHAFCALAGVGYALSQAWLESRTVLSVGALSVNGSQAFMLGVTVLLAVRLVPLWIDSRRDFALPGFALPQLVLIASAGVSWLTSPLPATGAATIFKLVACTVALLFGYWTARDGRALPAYRRCIDAVALVAAVTGFIDLAGGAVDPVRSDELRAGGSFGSPIQIGTVSLLGVPAFVSRLLERRGSVAASLWPLLGLVVTGVGLFSAFTRRSLVAAGLFFMALATRRRGRTSHAASWGWIVLMIFAVTSGVLVVTDSTLEGRLRDLPLVGAGEPLHARIGSGRPLIWGAMLRALGDNGPTAWIIGNGLHASYVATQERIRTEASAHNSYLELLYNQGLLGLGAYVAFLASVFGRLREASRVPGEVGLLAGIWGRFLLAFACAVDMFGSAIYSLDTRWYLYLMLGGVLGSAARPSARETDRVTADTAS